MKRIKFTGFPHSSAYRKIGQPFVWLAGEVREVSEPEAARLCETWPGSFAAEVSAPPRNTAKAGPTVRGGLDLLDRSVSDIRSALDTGSYDGDLARLLDAEEACKTRSGAVKAIKARMKEIAGGV